MIPLDYSRAYFRADGAPDAGMGHLTRCRNLALALKKTFEVVFLVDEAPDHFLSQLDRDAIVWQRTPDDTGMTYRQIVIFDGYAFGQNDFIAARNRDAIVVAIDDMAAQFFDCDLIVSQGPQNDRSDYRAANGCDFLLGVDYALIDPLFYDRRRTFSSDVRRVFVSFGGADPMNLTSFALDAIAGMDFRVEAVVGAGYTYWNELQSTARPNVTLHRALQPYALASLMSTCDAAICSGGTMSLELMAVGIPALLFAFAENHVRPCQALAAQGLAHFGGIILNDRDSVSFQKIVGEFLLDEQSRESINSTIAKKFVKSGLPIIADRLSSLSYQKRTSIFAHDQSHVQLAPLSVHHLDQTRRWITDRRVSKPFLFAQQITEQSHTEWFSSLQSDRSQLVFAVLRDGEHIGNAGFKNIERHKREAELWIYLSPEVHGRGIGTDAVQLVLKSGFEQLALDRVYLHVNAANLAARRVYEKTGFHVSAAAAKCIVFEGIDTTLDRMVIGKTSRQGSVLQRPRVALMQPTFLPWLGYFELMDTADIFVFLDDFQFSRQSWGQRNRLFLSPGRAGLVSMPIQHPGNLAASFLDIRPDADQRWIGKLTKSLYQAYGKAPFFAETWIAMEPLLRKSELCLADFEISLIEYIARRLGIRTQLRRSSEFGIENLGRSERLVALLDAVGAGSYYAARGSAEYMHDDGVFPLRRLPVFFQRFEPTPYRQAGSPQFVPGLSALDALFNLSPEDARLAMFGTRKWLSWQDANGYPIDQSGPKTVGSGI